MVDPACGCGSFLLTAAQFLKERYGLSYKEIFGSYIVGFDIDGHSIEKAKVLFNILSLEEEGTSIEEGCELHTVNSLQELSKKTYKNTYDVVIGNPPYVRAKNMEKQVKESVKLWSVVSGNVDLYIPFYQLAVEILKLDGVMGYISPNTFLQSVNGKGLRNYLVGRGYKIAVLDFRETKMFQDISYYTCICLIFKGKSTYDLDYALLNGESSLDKYEFTTYNIKNYPVNKEWRFGNSRIDDIIRRIESQPHRLEDYKIRNGLATLKNDLYFFRLREWTTTTITERTEERKSP